MSDGHPEQDRIEEYLGGAMNDAGRARFERDMAAGPALAAEVAAWRAALEEARAWALDPAPGAERLEQLRAPRLGGNARVVTIRSTHPALAFAGKLAWRVAALAAVFVVGYLAGIRETGPSGMAPQSTVAAQTAEVRVEPPGLAVPEPAAPPPVATADAAAAPGSAADATTPAPTYATEEDGRVVVQTTLPASGARVTWVVDAAFQIPDAERASQL